jgi:truncated hemoglobin YjbI
MEHKKYLIKNVVEDFYKLATNDVLIGHQFRKIAMFEGSDPLKPPFEAFAHHIPRIIHFWEIQLLGLKKQEDAAPFDLIGIHKKLFIRKGELGRWLVLFDQTVDSVVPLCENKEERMLLEEWKNKAKRMAMGIETTIIRS